MREKENVNDYRYFPDPDLPVIVITDEEIDEIVRSFPMLADQREKKYINDFNLTKQDASCLTQSKIIADLFDYTQKICNNALEVKKWILGPLLECVNDKGILTENIKITPYQLSKIINLVLEGKISRQSAKLVLSNCIENENFDIESFILNDNLILIDESDVIENAVKQVIEQNKKAVSQYKQGENKVFTFLVGQCMKKLKGNGKAQTVNKILKEYLSK